MGAPISRLLVAVDGSRAIVRVCGRACFTCSSDFRALVYDLFGRGLRQFVLELGECTIMDSTFLGILARFAQRLRQEGGGGSDLVLWNPPTRIVDLLENLGVAQLFKVEQNQTVTGAQCTPLEPGVQDKLTATRDALEAHRTLMELNPANEVKFKDVAEYMAQDLKRLEGH